MSRSSTRAPQRLPGRRPNARSIVFSASSIPTGHLSFQSTDYPAFNGLCLVIVRSKAGERGTLTLKVRGDGVDGTEATLVSR